MKKTAAMLLALLLFALPVLGQAAKLKEYTHPTYGYSLQHPSDWLVVDAENIDGYIAAYENGTLRHGAADAETLSMLAPDIHEMDMTMLMDTFGNWIQMNYYSLGYTMTIHQFSILVLPQILREIKNYPYYAEAEFLTDGEIVTYGENTFALLAVELKDGQGLSISEDILFLLDGDCIFEIHLNAHALFSPIQKEQFYSQTRRLLASLAFPSAQE